MVKIPTQNPDNGTEDNTKATQAKSVFYLLLKWKYSQGFLKVWVESYPSDRSFFLASTNLEAFLLISI